MVVPLSRSTRAPSVSTLSRQTTGVETVIAGIDLRRGTRNVLALESSTDAFTRRIGRTYSDPNPLFSSTKVSRARATSQSKLTELKVQLIISDALKKVDDSFADDAVDLLLGLRSTVDDTVEDALDTSLLKLTDVGSSLSRRNTGAAQNALQTTAREAEAAQDLLQVTARRNRTEELDELLQKNRSDLKYARISEKAVDASSTSLNDLDETFRALARARGEQLDITMRRANGQFKKASDARKAVKKRIARFNQAISAESIDDTAIESMQASLDKIRQRVEDIRLSKRSTAMLDVSTFDLDGAIDTKQMQFWDDFDVLPQNYRGVVVDPPPTMRKIIEGAGESKNTVEEQLGQIEKRLKQIGAVRTSAPPGLLRPERFSQRKILQDATFLDNLPADSQLRSLAQKTPDEISALGDDYWDDVSRLLQENTGAMSRSQQDMFEVANLQSRFRAASRGTGPPPPGKSWSDIFVGDDGLVPISVGEEKLTDHVAELTQIINRNGGDIDALDSILRSKYADVETTRATLLQANKRTVKTASEIEDEANAIFADMQEWTSTFPGAPGDQNFASWKQTLEGATDVGKKREAIAAFNDQARLITRPRTAETIDKIKAKLRKTGQAHQKTDLNKIAGMLDDGDIDGALEKLNKSISDMDTVKGKLSKADVAKFNRRKKQQRGKKIKRGGRRTKKRTQQIAAKDKERIVRLQDTRKKLEQVLDAPTEINVTSVRRQAAQRAVVTKKKTRLTHTADWGRRLKIGATVGGAVVLVGGIATMIAAGIENSGTGGSSVQGAAAVSQVA